jgi:DNA repair ATPase RecN
VSSSEKALKDMKASLAKLAETLNFNPEDALTGIIQEQLRSARDEVQPWKDIDAELNEVMDEMETAKAEAVKAEKEFGTVKAAWNRRREKYDEIVEWFKKGDDVCGTATG